MTNLPPIHITLMQPAGYVHSLGLLDQARYVRYQLQRLGATVTIAKNRVREDALNIVFGAHLGFPPDWRRRHACVFFNLEQLGSGGAPVSDDYIKLLRGSAVADYDAANIPAYAADAAEVPVLPFLHAPYLESAGTMPIAERPIDLLFFGSMNERRRAFINRIEACGVAVSMFDHPLYGEERDAYIRQSKAVLNCSFYETSRFEQARVFQCLSMGTPVISEHHADAHVPAAFTDSVFWIDPAGHALETFFTKHFGTGAYASEAGQKLASFRGHDPIESYADLLWFACGYLEGHGITRLGTGDTGAWRPSHINLGSGKDYKPGWLNLDVQDRAEPDAVLDIGQPITLPLVIENRFGGQIELAAGTIDRLYANNVLEHVPDLSLLMTNALALLKDGGRFDIEVPYERALTAWQDPTHVRALNQNSWIYYTEWFWYLGWFEHRFNMIDSTYLDLKLQPCTQEHAAFMRVAFMKVETTARERNIARTMQADLRLPDDEFAPAPERRPVVPVYSAPAAGSPAPMKPMPSILPAAAAPVGAPTLPAARPAVTAPGGLDIATLDLLATTRSEALRRAAQAAVAG